MHLALVVILKAESLKFMDLKAVAKPRFAFNAIAEVQKQGGITAFIDAEHAIDPLYARNLGIDLNTLILSQPDSGEQAMEIVDILAKSGAVDLIVVDSVVCLSSNCWIRRWNARYASWSASLD